MARDVRRGRVGERSRMSLNYGVGPATQTARGSPRFILTGPVRFPSAARGSVSSPGASSEL